MLLRFSVGRSLCVGAKVANLGEKSGRKVEGKKWGQFGVEELELKLERLAALDEGRPEGAKRGQKSGSLARVSRPIKLETLGPHANLIEAASVHQH